MVQSPACKYKKWRHTGAYKNMPRPNHVEMNGQVVEVDKPFELNGIRGGIYHPMYPRDSSLPVEEVANCHCLAQPVADKDVLGMDLEARQKLQQEIIDADDREWEAQLEAENKARAGIEPYNELEEFKNKSREKQVKYIGGKAKMGLYDAGLVDSEEMLKKVKNSTLQELADDGIFTVSSSAMKHSTVGEFSSLKNPKKPAGGMNGGNMRSGGHSQANINELEKRGINYKIEKTYESGVRIGGVANHNNIYKNLGKTGQAWFPEDWDDYKICAAGTYTSNKPTIVIEVNDDGGNIAGYRKFQEYEDVTVGIFEDAEHNIKSIFPDEKQRKVSDWYE
jgi:hypothetical protein